MAKKFLVLVSEFITEIMEVEVEAESEKDAEQAAISQVIDTGGPDKRSISVDDRNAWVIREITTEELEVVSATDPNYERRQILNELLDWAEQMGGFDSPVWDRAREYRDSLFPPGPATEGG